MRRSLGWMMVIWLCCAAGGETGEEQPAARLREAQAALDEASKLMDSGGYSEARIRAEHALELREAVLGSTHPDIAPCLSLLGTLYRLQGDLASAEPLFQSALSIRETGLGKNHPEVARALHNLANLYQGQGLYERAEPLYLRALSILEATLGKSHPDVAIVLNETASLYSEQGLYGQAESLYLRALSIRETVLGESHPDVAATLNGLADLYKKQGLYERAEPLFQRALSISKATLGENHPSVAEALNNFALLYWSQGLYERAEPLLQRALSILTTTLGESHPNVATALHNLAGLYLDQGLYERAEPLLQRALSIRETALGENHIDVASSLNNLAKLYKNRGLYKRAEPLLQRALSIHERTLGHNHRDVAGVLYNLASLYQEQGLYDRARPLYQRTLSIMEGALGKTHHDISPVLNNLALLSLARHRLADALPLFARAFTLSERRLRQEGLVFSDSRLASFLQYLRQDEQMLYALLHTYPESAQVRRLALAAALLLKGRSIEEMASISRTLYRELGAENRATLEKLRGLRTQLATLSLAGPGTMSPKDYQQRIQSLTEASDSLEADLARRSAPLRALTTLPSPAQVVDQIAASLPRDGALVEFIAYAAKPLLPSPQAPRSETPVPLRYLALVLFPNASVRTVDLGPAEPIDQAALSLRNALANRDASFQATSQELYQLAFQPLRSVLGTTQRLFLSPDGQLGLVPFAALHDGHGFLLDSFDFIYLTSGKQLLPPPQTSVPSSSIFVLANPDFTASPRAAPSTSDETSTQGGTSEPLERFAATLSGRVNSSSWLPLPGTQQEAEDIQRLLPHTQLFLGPEATKENLLHLPTPGILHLATHGFFLEDTSTSTSQGLRTIRHLRSRARSWDTSTSTSQSLHTAGHFGALGDQPLAPPPEPLLRSGLVLAGADAPASEATTLDEPGPSNALVTALELAGLNLWGTQLVVLSACDTGRGDVKLGQGIYGLRRALVIAGAETVVMSLWKIRDDSTRLLMDSYYHNLVAGQGRASALREAMRSLRASRPHPHDWAPFIALGSDAPLRGITPAVPRAPEAP